MDNHEVIERAYEDSIAHRYNRDYHEPPIMQWHDDVFAKFVADHCRSGDRILDLGCGPASIWASLNHFLPVGCTLDGIDLSEKMIEEARSLYSGSNFKTGSMFAIPADTATYDLVIVSSAFHHIFDETLPKALEEISRVLEEHGMLIGREPLQSGRLGDRGGWFSGALMHFRHLVYRLTQTKEYPEPDPGPAHHAYDAAPFLRTISDYFAPQGIEFRFPVSPFVARSRHPLIAKLARILDESIEHREGQVIHYLARKNYSNGKDIEECIDRALAENKIHDPQEFLAFLLAATRHIEDVLGGDESGKNHLLSKKNG